MSEVDPRRLAILRVPREQVYYGLFAQPLNGMAFVRTTSMMKDLDGPPVAWQSCEIVDVETNWQRNTIDFKLRSPEFNIVATGDVIPNVAFVMEERQVDVYDPAVHPPRQTFEQWQAERRDIVAALREVCEHHGDNEWTDNINLGDAINMHLGNHLYAGDLEELSDEELLEEVSAESRSGSVRRIIVADNEGE